MTKGLCIGKEEQMILQRRLRVKEVDSDIHLKLRRQLQCVR